MTSPFRLATRLKRPAALLAVAAVATLTVVANPVAAHASASDPDAPQFQVTGKGTTLTLAQNRAVDKATDVCANWTTVRQYGGTEDTKYTWTIVFNCP